MADRDRYVIYARQSLTRTDDESLSIEMQVKSCKQFVQSRGGTVVGTYEEPDTRGWRTDRPQFSAMLDRFRQGGADYAVVFKLSRFARNLIHQETVMNEIADAGGELVSVTEPYLNGSPMVRQILGAVNEQSKRDQSDFLQGAFATRAKRGLHHGYAPLGYAKGDDGRLVIDETTADTIRMMFGWAREGHGSPEITYRLNERGIVTRNGTQWSQTSTLRTLQNRVYAGDIVFNGDVACHNAHPAIIAPEDFTAVQEALSRRKRVRRKASPSWADGFVYHACGARMYVAKWSAPGYDMQWRFRCGTNYRIRKDRPETTCPHAPSSIFQSKIEEAFLDLLVDALSDIATPEQAMRRIEAQQDSSKDERDRQRVQLGKRIDDVQRQRDRLLDLALAGRVDDEMYTARDAALKEELSRLHAERDDVPEDVPESVLRGRHATITRIADALPVVAHSAHERLPEMLHDLGARLVVGGGKPRLQFGEDMAPFVRGS